MRPRREIIAFDCDAHDDSNAPGCGSIEEIFGWLKTVGLFGAGPAG
jgi:hypothetical protein